MADNRPPVGDRVRTAIQGQIGQIGDKLGIPQIQGHRQREDRSHSPPFRTFAKVRYVKSRLTGNAAAGNAYNVADMASLLQAVRNAGANTWSSSALGVLERLLAVGGLGEQHPHAGLSTQRAQHRQRRRLLALLRPKPPAVRGQALPGVACRRRHKKYESPQSTPVAAAQPHASGPSPTEEVGDERRGEAGRSCEGGHEAARGYLQHIVGRDLFEISRRRTWPFHIQNPEMTSIGTKTNRTAGA